MDPAEWKAHTPFVPFQGSIAMQTFYVTLIYIRMAKMCVMSF